MTLISQLNYITISRHRNSTEEGITNNSIHKENVKMVNYWKANYKLRRKLYF